MALKHILFICTCLTVFLAYRYGYQTFPEDSSLSIKLSLVVLHMIMDISELASVLGLGDAMLLQRKVLDAIPVNIPVPESVTTEDVMFDGVMVRIYKPLGASDKSPAVIYFHGGGWIFASIEWTNGRCGKMAEDLNITVVSVEYRRAPEYIFPIPMEDCEQATLHLLKHAKNYGIDPARVALAGDSAGANLAAAVALKLRDMKVVPPLKAQVLLYPPLQALDFSTPSYQDHEKGSAVLRRTDMVSMWLYYAQGHINNLNSALQNKHVHKNVKKDMGTSYLNHDLIDKKLRYPYYVSPEVCVGNNEVWNELKDILTNPYYAPLMASDVSGLPVSFISFCEYDVLRDDGIWYSERLKSSGVKVHTYYSSTGHHGIMSMPEETPEAVKMKKAVYKFLETFL